MESGFGPIDKLIGGLPTPGVLALIGDQGTGKTLTVLKIAESLARKGIPVVIIDAEGKTPKEILEAMEPDVRRKISIYTGKSLSDIADLVKKAVASLSTTGYGVIIIDGIMSPYLTAFHAGRGFTQYGRQAYQDLAKVMGNVRAGVTNGLSFIMTFWLNVFGMDRIAGGKQTRYVPNVILYLRRLVRKAPGGGEYNTRWFNMTVARGRMTDEGKSIFFKVDENGDVEEIGEPMEPEETEKAIKEFSKKGFILTKIPEPVNIKEK